MPVSESTLQERVANYLRLQYPEVLFHSDFGSGAKLIPRQAARRLDAELSILWSAFTAIVERNMASSIPMRSSMRATEYIAEQAKVLEDLRSRGYCAEFAVGFGEVKKIIDEYLEGE